VNTAYTIGNSASSQTLLPSGATTLTTTASTWYRFNGVFYLSKTTGSTSHFAALGFANSTNISNISYRVIANDSAGLSKILSTVSDVLIGNTNNTQITATMTSTTQNFWFSVDGTFSTSTAGTLIPTIGFSTAPGGSYTVNVGSYFTVQALGPTGSNISVGFA
jgi:hypothetical protein